MLKKINLGFVVPLLAVIGASALYLQDPQPLQVLRNSAFDQYQRWHPRVYREAPVRIVDIDDQSLKTVGQWPWPRTRMAELVEKLRAAGATAIALDVVFAEADRTSPKAVSRQWKLTGDVAEKIAALPDHDAEFAKTLAKGKVILGFAADHGGALEAGPPPPFRVVTSGAAALAEIRPFSGTVRSIPVLDHAAAGNGVITFNNDSDGVVRRVPLMFRFGDQLQPSLTAEALRVSQGETNYFLKASSATGGGIAEVRIGKVAIPTTPGAEVWIHYRPLDPSKYIPAWKVLADQTPAESIRGKIILIGTSAQGLMDLRSNPLGTIMPGIEAHAQMLEQVLTEQYLDRPARALSLEALVIFAGGLMLMVVAMRTGALVSAAVTVVTLALVAWSSWFAFTDYGLLIDPITPVLCLAGIYVTASVMRHLASERRQRWVRAAFSRYVSPNLVTFLVNNPGQLELGGKRQTCSFIFTDLVSFTSLMEKIDAGQAVALLNDYLDGMIAIAFRHEGTLDRIVGDAVAIVFSAPVEQADHPRRALACAVEMLHFATAYADALRVKDIPFGYTRIGVHSGEVIVGNFGGSTIFDYRALGDPVNTASRLEGLNKYLGTLICVSGVTLASCPGAVVRPVGEIVLKGKSLSLPVFEPLLMPDGTSASVRDTDYEAAYALLAGDTAGALIVFEKLHADRPQDGLVKFHLERLRSGASGTLIVMTGK